MDSAQPDQPAIKIHRFTHRSRLVLILTLMIAAFMRLPTLIMPMIVLAVIFSLIGLAIFWYVVHHYLNFTAALIFGLMYALSPWQIFYTQQGFVDAIFSSKISPEPNPVLYKLWTATGLGIENTIAPTSSNLLIANLPRPTEVWLLLLGGAVLLGFPALWFRSQQIFIGVILWIAISILLSLLTGYLIPAILPLCILAGAGVAWLIKLMPGKPYSRMIILSAYGVVFLSQALWWRGVLRYLELAAH